MSPSVRPAWTDGRLRLSYLVGGPLDRLHLPTGGQHERQDELWRTTCFEVFVRTPGGYVEYNLSPSTAWAAYIFHGYRKNMAPLEGIAPPTMDSNGGSSWYELIAEIELPPQVEAEAHVGLSSVIAAADGSKSFWALTHAPGPPDFHNPACFLATLPPPDGR